MGGIYLQLAFEPHDIHSKLGSARIKAGAIELSHDCGSLGELEAVIDRVEADLKLARSKGKAKFAQRAAQLRTEALPQI